MVKDKQGNQISWKEFMSRWKQGMEGINASQQTHIQLWFTWIVVIGIVLGIVISIFVIKQLYWLLIVLIGALGNTLVQLLGLWQKKRILDSFIVPKEDYIEIPYAEEVKNE